MKDRLQLMEEAIKRTLATMPLSEAKLRLARIGLYCVDQLEHLQKFKPNNKQKLT